ncbi:hypothetical protein Tco_1258587 [Tanacetum coccineum]
MLEVDLFMCLQIPLFEEIKQTWTDEMEDYFDSLIEIQRSDRINRHFDDKNIDNMGDEVAEDNSAHASFMTQNNVSNMVDSSMAQMQKTMLNKKNVSSVCNYIMDSWLWESNSLESIKRCRIIMGWDPNSFTASLLSKSDQVMHFLITSVTNGKSMYISFVYGENYEKNRVRLWKNLEDHKNVVGSHS